MTNTILVLVILLFVGMLFVNIYFRMKVLKAFQRMRRNGLKMELTSKHLFNPKFLEEDILQKHPEHREDIEIFIHNIRFSIRMATILIAIITLFGAVLLFNHYYGV